ncbi:TPA: major capsid protein, partial [Morganella morganii subsp. morganii]|nr:major capsid protein [Morganella morganii subsp. morganii]
MNIFDTNVLIQVVPNLMTSQNWLLDKFFPNITESDTEEVSIDVDVGLRRLAPFVSPLVEGKLVESRKFQTNSFKPAYIKDKRAPDLRKPIRRQIGERIGGQYSAAEREMLNLQFELADQIDMINRRLEWMAASALQTGTVTVTGEGYETQVVDFGRSSDLTIALSGADKWPETVEAGKTNTKPSADIEDWAQRMLKESGAVATDIIFTTKSWKA